MRASIFRFVHLIVITMLAAAGTAQSARADHAPYDFSPYGWNGKVSVVQQGEYRDGRTAVQLAADFDAQVAQDGYAVYTGKLRRTTTVTSCPDRPSVVYSETEEGIVYSTHQQVTVQKSSGPSTPGGSEPYAVSLASAQLETDQRGYGANCDLSDYQTFVRRGSASIPGVVLEGSSGGGWEIPVSFDKPTVPRLNGSHTQSPVSHGTITTTYDLTGCGQEVGRQWRGHFLDRKEISALSEPFRSNVQRFVAAMKDARRVPSSFGARETGGPIDTRIRAPISVFVNTTYRPWPRAYLMHYAWRIAHGRNKPNYTRIEPDKVPPYHETEGINHHLASVPICWMVRTAGPDGSYDRTESIEKARELVGAYGIVPKFGAAYPTRHSRRTAIDMTIRWAGDIAVRWGPASGPVRQPWAIIRGGPRTGMHPVLWRVGESYRVIKYKNTSPPDPPHWSDNGN